jgi:hypothetical protein
MRFWGVFLSLMVKEKQVKGENMRVKNFDERRWLEQRFADLCVGQLDTIDQLDIDALRALVTELEDAQRQGELDLETDAGLTNLKRIVEKYR